MTWAIRKVLRKQIVRRVSLLYPSGRESTETNEFKIVSLFCIYELNPSHAV